MNHGEREIQIQSHDPRMQKNQSQDRWCATMTTTSNTELTCDQYVNYINFSFECIVVVCTNTNPVYKSSNNDNWTMNFSSGNNIFNQMGNLNLSFNSGMSRSQSHYGERTRSQSLK